MLVQNSVYRNTYLTDGVNKDFYFSFPILEASQVLVQTSLLTDTDRVTTIDPSQYTVTGVGLTTGGHISFTTAPPTGSRIALTLNMPITQLYQYAELDSFPAKSHENALAKLTLICQQLKEQLERAVRLPSTSSESPETVVASIYASRDAAATSASTASSKATAAANSASTAAQTVTTAAAEAISAATAQANAAHDSALAAAQSAIDAAAAVPENLVQRVTDVEAAASTAQTTADTAKAVTDKVTPTPTANAVPQADGSGKIDGWVTPTAILNASTLLTSSGTHTPTKTRLARITIKGGGGGGAGGTGYPTFGASGSGGGEGETVIFWASLDASVAYPLTIGAGGLAGAANASGGNGGTTTFLGRSAAGGYGGVCASGPGNVAFTGGRGGLGGGSGLNKGENGQSASIGNANAQPGGDGGGKNGGRGELTEAPGQSAEAGSLGCGGGGGDYYRSAIGAKGGNGYVLIEFFDPSVAM